MSQTEINKAAVRSYVAALNAGCWERLRELFSPNAAIQGVTGSAPIEGACPRIGLASAARRPEHGTHDRGPRR